MFLSCFSGKPIILIIDGVRANRGRSDKIPNKKLLQNKDVIRHNCASIRARSTSFAGQGCQKSPNCDIIV